jgi:acyl phosphate:glycerol-3-phosphate acyltransferase
MFDLPSTFLPYLTIPFGYLLGSVPAAFLVGKYLGKQDIREEGDGKVSAAAIYRRMGKWPFLLVVCFDVGKGIFIAAFTGAMFGSMILLILASLATVIGHCWPVFLKFKGGLGATVIYGVLGGTVILQLLMSFIPGLIFLFATKKSGMSTAVIIVSLSVILLIQYLTNWEIPFFNITPALIVFPIILILFMTLKRLQIANNNNTNNNFS